MNIECDRIKERLAAYAVGALAPDEQIIVDEHVDGCANCRYLLNEYRDIIATLPEIMADVSPHELPDTLKTSVLQQVVRQLLARLSSALNIGKHVEGALGQQTAEARDLIQAIHYQVTTAAKCIYHLDRFILGAL